VDRVQLSLTLMIYMTMGKAMIGVGPEGWVWKDQYNEEMGILKRLRRRYVHLMMRKSIYR